MIAQLKTSPLFSGLSDDEIEDCLACSKSEVRYYQKDDMIFNQYDEPVKLMVLVDGAVAVCHDNASGKRSIVAAFNQTGELFGEVFLFLKRKEYDHYAQAVTPAKVLQIPRDFLFQTCAENCNYHTRLIANMLSILAQKAYLLNQKVQMLSSGSLRQKIAKILLKNCRSDGKVLISMNREEMADFLNAARPSLSRELMKMQEEGLIKIYKKNFLITDKDELQNYL